MDWEAASLKVAALVNAIDEYDVVFDANYRVALNPRDARKIRERDLSDAIQGALPAARAIAMEAGQPEVAARLRSEPASYDHEWRLARGAAAEMLGFLTSKAELDAILGPVGPQLAASSLHPVIWGAAAALWDGGHPRQAIQTAAQALEGLVRNKVGRHDAGAKLGTAFSLDPPTEAWPRLRIPGLVEGTDTWRSAHEGAGALLRGAFQYVRNLASHPGAPEPSPEEALEQVALLSLVARIVEGAEVLAR